MAERENIDRKVTIRMTESLYSELESEMSAYGYRTISQFIRFILEKRNHRGIDSPAWSKGMRSAIEHLSSEIRKIGVLYNQFVAAYNRAVSLKGPDGEPRVSTKETQRNQLALMDLTVQMTRLLHSLMDRAGVEHRDITVRKTEEQKAQENPPQRRVVIPKF